MLYLDILPLPVELPGRQGGFHHHRLMVLQDLAFHIIHEGGADSFSPVLRPHVYPLDIVPVDRAGSGDPAVLFGDIYFSGGNVLPDPFRAVVTDEKLHHFSGVILRVDLRYRGNHDVMDLPGLFRLRFANHSPIIPSDRISIFPDIDFPLQDRRVIMCGFSDVFGIHLVVDIVQEAVFKSNCCNT